MSRDPLEALQALAALKAQRALAELAAAKARAAEEAQAAEAADRAAAETYPDDVETAAELQGLWRARGALHAQASDRRKREAARLRDAEAVRDRAAQEKARELGAEALVKRAARQRAEAEARRAERLAGTLAALRKPQL